jgi:hypothetical protein
MKDSRIGESLWFTWDGDDYEPVLRGSNVYYTTDHVDLSNDLVKKALASSLQRDGLALSLSQGYLMVDAGYIIHGYSGIFDSELHPIVCNQSGETRSGDFANEVAETTWVEVLDF